VQVRGAELCWLIEGSSKNVQQEQQVEDVKIRAKPLTGAVARAGGFEEVFERAMKWLSEEEADALRDEWTQVWEAGRKVGWFDLYWADTFIITALGVHPFEVYYDWFELQESLRLPYILDEGKVRDIRRRAQEGETCTAIAADLGADTSNIAKVIRGRTWKHVTEQEVAA
jgi:hypothetical protein